MASRAKDSWPQWAALLVQGAAVVVAILAVVWPYSCAQSERLAKLETSLSDTKESAAKAKQDATDAIKTASASLNDSIRSFDAALDKRIDELKASVASDLKTNSDATAKAISSLDAKTDKIADRLSGQDSKMAQFEASLGTVSRDVNTIRDNVGKVQDLTQTAVRSEMRPRVTTTQTGKFNDASQLPERVPGHDGAIAFRWRLVTPIAADTVIDTEADTVDAIPGVSVSAVVDRNGETCTMLVYGPLTAERIKQGVDAKVRITTHGASRGE
ncbi:MAG TPA: hypothetical protein VHX65_01075 [Pirellulales bacterium]|jgi:hypothetical protein|nr:hypothetical protein [Pirellulales bacterium]